MSVFAWFAVGIKDCLWPDWLSTHTRRPVQLQLFVSSTFQLLEIDGQWLSSLLVQHQGHWVSEFVGFLHEVAKVLYAWKAEFSKQCGIRL